MSDLLYAVQAYREALTDAFEFAVDPVQLIVGGVLLDVKSIAVESSATQPLGSSDTLLRAKLQDGRELIVLASKVDAFITGRPWE